MINSNPETVSTDYDTSDILYFEPLTLEDVLNVIEFEEPFGIVVQFGGQTPLKLSLPIVNWLEKSENSKLRTKVLGTSPISIDLAEDREQFDKVLRRLDIRQPKNGLARTFEESLNVANKVGYPLVVRPSYVLGGRAMEIVYEQDELERYIKEAVNVEPDHPILIDQYLENAIEVDVDALCDVSKNVVIGGNSAVQQFTRIGKMAMIGGMTGVLHDVIPYGLSTGNRNSLQGLNLIGLRRAKFENKDILGLSEAYKEIFATKNINENISKLNGSFQENPLVKNVIDFITKDKKRSICTPFS